MSRYSTLTNDPPLRRRHSLADKLISAPDARQRPPDPALQNRKLKLFGATNEKNRVEVIKKKTLRGAKTRKGFMKPRRRFQSGAARTTQKSS